MPNTGDVLSHSTDNAIANWETVVLEIGISAVLAVGVNLTMLATVAPMIAGIFRAPRREEVLSMVVRLLVSMLISGFVWIVVTAFPIAANARTYVDGERAAAAAPVRTREAYRVFAWPAWLAAGRALWARVFGIEIIAVAIAAAVIVIPFAALFALPRMAAGCLGVLIVLPLALAAFVMMTLCARKAVVVAAARGTGVGESLRIAWDDVKGRFIAHLLPALVIGVLAAAASFVLGLAGAAMKLVLGPLPIVPVLRAVAAACAVCWLLAAFVALTEER